MLSIFGMYGGNNSMIDEFKEFIFINEHLQKSQINLVLFVTKMKENGFFVEFGTCDGVELSNTLTLEKNFNWNGILAEPSISWHNELFKNRKCFIDKRAVWKESKKELDFVEVESIKTISGIDTDLFKSNFTELRKNVYNNRFKVETITLRDLLIEYNTPKQIDYLSIDTEGSELAILKTIDFNKYNIGIMIIEYNYYNQELLNLLEKNNFEIIEHIGMLDLVVRNKKYVY
jgi:FkbM family methyltransferase